MKCKVNESKPLISIVIPVFNGSNYLREAIDSAINQTYNNIEIIVVNDGSNDNDATKSIALSYGDKIRYVEKINGGVSSALNIGINLMNGDYFSWLSHDDVYFENKIEAQINILSQSSDNIILYSGFCVINESSDILYSVKNHSTKSDNFLLDLLCYSGVHGCTVLVPKACFDKVGLFNEDLLHVQDIDFWVRANKIFNFQYLDKVLVKSRHHEHQTSKVDNANQRPEKENFIINVFKDNIENKIDIFNYYPVAYLNMKRLGYNLVVQYLNECKCIEINRNGFFKKNILYSWMTVLIISNSVILAIKYIRFNARKKYSSIFNI